MRQNNDRSIQLIYSILVMLNAIGYKVAGKLTASEDALQEVFEALERVYELVGTLFGDQST
jgi:hypothetical protein